MIKKKIINEIQKTHSGISLEKFIDISLFDKEGYYKNSNPLGKSGDFTTAPEISQLFGEILGLYIFSIWEKKYKSEINFIELGPGNGTLLIDTLRITRHLLDFHKNLNIHLIEKNNALITKQKQNLFKYNFDKLKIRWHHDFINITQKPSIIVANEFLDCLPIRQFQKKNNIWFEKMINFDLEEKRFFYQMLKLNQKTILKKLIKYKDNDIVELSEQRENYFNYLCQYLSQSSGTIIIIDYGYYNFPGYFTLQTIYNNKPSNLLDNIGTQDITSLVNFKKLIDIAKKHKLNVDLFCKQSFFLLKNGILERKNKIIKKCNTDQKKIIENGFRRLVDEEHMGSIFKFLIVSK